MLDLVNESTIKFKFVMAGKTGVGKSSVITLSWKPEPVKLRQTQDHAQKRIKK